MQLLKMDLTSLLINNKEEQLRTIVVPKKKKIVICKHLGKIRIDLNKAVKSPHAVYEELFVRNNHS